MSISLNASCGIWPPQAWKGEAKRITPLRMPEALLRHSTLASRAPSSALIRSTNFHMRTYVNRRYKITVYRKWDDGELWDLQEDPGEINNLWHDPAAVGLKAQLLREFMQATLQCEPTRMPRIAGA